MDQNDFRFGQNYGRASREFDILGDPSIKPQIMIKANRSMKIRFENLLQTTGTGIFNAFPQAIARASATTTMVLGFVVAASAASAQTTIVSEMFTNDSGGDLAINSLNNSEIAWNAYFERTTSGGVVGRAGDSATGVSLVLSDGVYQFNPSANVNFVNGNAMIYATGSSVPPTPIGNLASFSVDSKAIGSAGNPAEGRFLIQMNETWYASDFSWTSDSAEAVFATKTLSGVDFADAANWRMLTLTTSTPGEITVADTAVGGTLSGNVTQFGIFAKAGGTNGEPFQVDNFIVSAMESTATWYGYEIVDGYVDTGAWMGWLSVAEDPWVYSYLLQGWLYMPEQSTDNGAWLYVIP